MIKMMKNPSKTHSGDENTMPGTLKWLDLGFLRAILGVRLEYEGKSHKNVVVRSKHNAWHPEMAGFGVFE